MKYPSELMTLISFLRKLPGIGFKTAERFAFTLLEWKEGDLKNFSSHLATLKEKIRHCPTCYAMIDTPACPFCQNPKRNQDLICILSSAKDVFSIEETKVYSGLYHVIDSLLSPLDGKGTESLRLQELKERIERLNVQEVIIALDSTLEGDATSLYLKEELSPLVPKISRIAFGLPLGSCLDFVDGGTLARALLAKQPL